MSLRQDKFIEELPKNKYNVTKAAKKAGYSDSYSETMLHTSIRKYKGWQDKLKEIYSEEGIKKEQAKALKDFKKTKDNTNRQRAIEFMGKIAGVVIDKQEVTEVNKEDNQFSLERLSRLRVNIEPVENKENKLASEN